MPAAQEKLAGSLDLLQATMVVRPGELPNAERTAAAVLIDEVFKRCGVRLPTASHLPASGPVIAITSQTDVPGCGRAALAGGAGSRPEGYRLRVELNTGAAPTVWIVGADPRGTLFGVGRLLRELDVAPGKLSLQAALDIATAPAYPIRGHQLDYRAQVNSYDAWDPAQFEQYIRELTFFGANSVEGIPFQDERPTPVMKFSRREMNRAIGEICHRYGLDYWLWLPEWDQAYALTLGREAVNPRPAEYAAIHNRLAGYSDGLISYSDGGTYEGRSNNRPRAAE